VCGASDLWNSWRQALDDMVHHSLLFFNDRGFNSTPSRLGMVQEFALGDKDEHFFFFFHSRIRNVLKFKTRLIHEE
jgi:hypothetical protein